ncbi:hypothetical protein G9C98_006497 [Cotesia typhae]|uniref:Uncharacterized protein n=1 Tax=Cotesia typhae TaxID=2053667 RepID=A0A8J5QXP9_9HYME|nr:hypothetical protein G9C98_006497 [Cotesia typhae]
MVNNEESQVQGILVNEHPLLGATLTAITLPDGSQAFVANDPEDLELKNPLDKATRTILISELSDLSNTPEQPDAGSSNQPEIPGVEIIDNDDAMTTYMVTSHAENQLWELSGEKCSNAPSKEKIFVKKISQSAHINFEEDFNEAEMDSTLEGLNIKIEDMEFGWN